MFWRFISPRLAEIARLEPFTWQKATPPSRVPRASRQGAPGRRATLAAFHLTKNSGNSVLGSEWNRHFPEFHSEILGVPREVGLKFRKIGITGKFRSIRPFLLGPSLSEPGNRIQHVVGSIYQPLFGKGARAPPPNTRERRKLSLTCG